MMKQTKKTKTAQSRYNLGKFREIIVFVIVGLSNTFLDIGITTLLSFVLNVSSGLILALINVFGFSVAVINSYLLNKYWTFKSTTKTSRTEIVKFGLISLGGLAINTGVLLVSEQLLFNIIDIPVLRVFISKISATIFTLVWNYGGYKIFVFK